MIPQWIGWGLLLAGFAMTLCIGLLYFGGRWAETAPHTAEKILCMTARCYPRRYGHRKSYWWPCGRIFGPLVYGPATIAKWFDVPGLLWLLVPADNAAMGLNLTPKTATYVWLGAAFFAAFFAAGSRSWPGSYQEYLSRGPIQLVAVIAIVALLVSALSDIGILRTTIAVGCGVPSAVLIRVFLINTDPTSHNLWPFQVVLALIFGMKVCVAGSIAVLCFGMSAVVSPIVDTTHATRPGRLAMAAGRGGSSVWPAAGPRVQCENDDR